MKKIILITLLINQLITASEVGEELYERCSGCHGKYGEIKALGKVKPIDFLKEKEIFSYLKAYKEKKRNIYGMGMLMSGQVANLDNSEMENLAKYISTFTGEGTIDDKPLIIVENGEANIESVKKILLKKHKNIRNYKDVKTFFKVLKNKKIEIIVTIYTKDKYSLPMVSLIDLENSILLDSQFLERKETIQTIEIKPYKSNYFTVSFAEEKTYNPIPKVTKKYLFLYKINKEKLKIVLSNFNNEHCKEITNKSSFSKGCFYYDLNQTSLDNNNSLIFTKRYDFIYSKDSKKKKWNVNLHSIKLSFDSKNKIYKKRKKEKNIFDLKEIKESTKKGYNYREIVLRAMLNEEPFSTKNINDYVDITWNLEKNNHHDEAFFLQKEINKKKYVYSKRIVLDLDKDNKLDRVYLEYKSKKVAKLVFELSSLHFEKKQTKWISIKSIKYGTMSLKKSKEGIQYIFSIDGFERIISTFQYNLTDKNIELMSFSREKDGDQDTNEAGKSIFDFKTHIYVGNWSPRNVYYSENKHKGNYRTPLSTIHTKINLDALSLDKFDEKLILKFRKICFSLYEKQFYKEYPHGNSMLHNKLVEDFDNDLVEDSLIFNSNEQRIVYKASETEKIIKSLPIILAFENLRIEEAKHGFYLKGELTDKDSNLVKEVSFQFRYDKNKMNFQLIGLSQIQYFNNFKIESSVNLLTQKYIRYKRSFKNNKIFETVKKKFMFSQKYLDDFNANIYLKFNCYANGCN